MSPAHPYIDGTIISIGDDDDVVAEEPQRPIPPPAYQGQASPFDPMPNHMGWNVPQPGGAMTGAQVYGTPAYKTQGGPPYMGQHSDIPTNGDPYAVQHTYPSPPMRYGNWPSQTPYGMDVGAPDARQVSRPQMQYLRGANSPTLQAHHDVVSPSQLAIATPGFGHNNIGYLNATGHPSAPYRANIANASFSSQHSNGPDPNPNSWTKDQDGLVYSLKTKRKKVTVKQIGAELKRRFNIERSDNAISKRWKIIKRRSSRVVSGISIKITPRPVPSLLFPHYHSRRCHTLTLSLPPLHPTSNLAGMHASNTRLPLHTL